MVGPREMARSKAKAGYLAPRKRGNAFTKRESVRGSERDVVTDRPDELFATGAGARLVRELRDEAYGSRGFSVADPEENLWIFGMYRGE